MNPKEITAEAVKRCDPPTRYKLAKVLGTKFDLPTIITMPFVIKTFSRIWWIGISETHRL